MTGRAAVYARISSDKEGRENGVQRQEELCLDLARRRDLDVLRVFIDNDISASRRSTKARPQYAAMLAAAERGEVDAIVAYSNSRLTRRPREFEDLIDLVEKRGTRIYTIASGRIDLATADGQMLARILAASDTAEADRAGERVKAAAEQRRQRGRWHGGNAPYGYRVEGERSAARLVPHDGEAALLREAATRLLGGDTLYGVVKDWNDRGVVTGRVGTKPRSDGETPGQHWRQGNLRAKLLNRALLGETKAGVVAWEPVLDGETFDRVTAKLSDPARNVAHSPGVRSTKYSMAGGLTVCGGCGHRMISNVHRERAILFCSKKYSGPGACGSNRIEHGPLEAYVLDHTVRQVESNPRWLQRNSEPDPDRERRVQALDAEVAALRDRRARVLDMYEEGLLDKPERARRLEPLAAAIEKARKSLDALLGQAQVSDVLRDGLDWRAWSSAKRRTFLRIAWGNVVVLPVRSSPPHRLKDEDGEAFEARRSAYMRDHVAARVGLAS